MEMRKSRNTKSKTAILELIKNSDVALSHPEIEERLGGICDRVTIYRVLERLEEEGEIHKIATLEGALKYASCHACTEAYHHDNHIHFCCEKCHSVTCIDEVHPNFNLPENYRINTVSFTVSGLCPNCV